MTQCGHEQPVTVATEIAMKQPFRIEPIYRAAAWSWFGRYARARGPYKRNWME
jgi:hypothetical protein